MTLISVLPIITLLIMTIRERILKFFIRDEISQVSEIEKRTFFLDTIRSGVDGIEITLGPSVFLLIAIQFFNVSDFWNSIISSSIFIGLMLSLFTSSFFAHKKPTVISGLFTIAGGFLLIVLGFAQNPIIYSIVVLFHCITIYQRPPLFTAIYESNYAPSRRGRLYSAGILLAIVAGLLSNYFFGIWLEMDLENFRWIFMASGFLFLISGRLLIKIPYSSERKKSNKNPLKNLGLLIKYPVFGIVSISWFIMGFANLWSKPLRIVYLVETERGLGLSPFIALIILGFVPNAVKLLFNNLWARIFDRFSFLPIRIITTLFIGSGIFLFFSTDRIFIIIVAQILMNIGFACSPFIWNLWVTQIAPPGESQAFMSVHTFLCGVRGIIGPFVGFLFIQQFSMRSVGIISLVLNIISVLILLPFLNHSAIRRR